MVYFNVVYNVIRSFRHVNTSQTINLNITRTYAKWVSRRPVAIVNENELFEHEDTTEKKIPTRLRRKPRKQKSLEQTKETPKTEKKNIITNLKENDKIVTSLMTKLRSRKKREKTDEVILEGHILIKEALQAGVTPKMILFNDFADIKELEVPEEVALYKVPYKTIQLWSSLTTSPGLLGVFNTPDICNKACADNALPLTIICDNVREPSNLGSILRAAAGVGCEKLIIMKGCVDLWNPKTLRSAAGAHFRLPIHTFPVWDEIPSLISEDCNIFVTDSNFGDQFIPEYTPAILEQSMEIFNIDPEDLKKKFSLYNDETHKAPQVMIPKNKNMMKNFMMRIPIVPYYALDYTKKETVIVLSGETEGLSFDSCKLLSERKSIRINIPLGNEINSLNTGVALGIVVFEIKRQFLEKQSKL